MIWIYEGQNESPATCSRNATLTNPYYLWVMEHKLSGQEFNFVPYRIIPSVSYPPGYDLFSIKVDLGSAQVLTGATTTGQTNVHLLDGEYYLSIYETPTQTLTIPSVDNLVYQAITQVVLSGASETPVAYSGTSSVFKIYEP